MNNRLKLLKTRYCLHFSVYFINGGSIVIVIYLVIESIKNVILPVMIKMIWLFVS